MSVITKTLGVDTNLTNSEWDALDWMDLVVVVPSGTNIKEALINFEVDLDVDGDYKDHNETTFNTYYMLLDAIDGLVIEEAHEGPRNWGIKWSYNGSTDSIGPAFER